MTLPEELEGWLDDDASGQAPADREELLMRAIVRLAEANDVDVPDGDQVAALERRVEELSTRNPSEADVDLDAVETDLDAVETDLDAVETDLDALVSKLKGVESQFTGLEAGVKGLETEVEGLKTEFEGLESDVEGKITDVRDRIIEVLRKVESKAPADHSHQEIEGSIRELQSEIEDVDGYTHDLESRLQENLGGIEDALDEFADSVQNVEGKMTKIAGAVVRLQRRVGDLEAERARRRSLADIATVANRHGITRAECGKCGKTVHIGLLAEPTCPHCEGHFDAVEPKSGFFGSPRLAVGDRPALEGPGEGTDEPSDVPGGGT